MNSGMTWVGSNRTGTKSSRRRGPLSLVQRTSRRIDDGLINDSQINDLLVFGDSHSPACEWSK
jgi:hypothetical protein